ncbi:DNA sulfur modification protein DndB [Streptomyces sp. NPDC056949]|uniref:DNA sulfur modification protein DndB n=1 Tax=Streptomyces sp. NPDC056949 TaxID=3345976 RepID=UPI00362657A4
MSVNLEDMDFSRGSYVKGIAVNEHQFLATAQFQQLRGVTRDPALLQPNTKQRASDPDLSELGELHDLVQRALQGNKKTNAKKYRRYIESVVSGGVGVLPPIHLWIPQPLDVATIGARTYAIVPTGEWLLSIDGETQLTAHFSIDTDPVTTPEMKKAHRELTLGVIIHHGVSAKVARQYFHDLNVLAVRPNTSLGLSMNTSDPLMQVVDDVQTLDVLRNRVEQSARQLGKKSNRLVTLQNLRQLVVNVAKGISGIQYGSRPVPVEDVDLEVLSEVSSNLVARYFDRYLSDIADREQSLAGTGPVLAAIGAMGNKVLQAPADERDAELERLFQTLKSVDWRKGPQWVGIAGNYTAGGVFSAKGTKEVAYAVHTALSDPSSATYRKIRQENAVGRLFNN